jgi:hypothetical protein
LAIAGIVVVGFAIFVADWWDRKFNPPLTELVTASIAYDPKGCGRERPLSITFQNGSNKTVREVQFNLIVHEPDRSTNLNTESGWTSDFIISPHSVVGSCWSLPSLEASPSKLQYEAEILWALEKAS